MYELGGRKSLQVAFSVLNEGCGGCQYESYPYKAQSPVRVGKKYPTLEFKSDEDVWKVIDLIIKETQEFNYEEGKSFDVSESVYSQLPFFACRNILFDKETDQITSPKFFGYSGDDSLTPTDLKNKIQPDIVYQG